METSRSQERTYGTGVVAIVEDDHSILDALALVLQGDGWETCVFDSGESFLADYHCGRKYDCLLLDPHLAGVTGAEVAEAVAGTGLPVLVITARPDSPLTKAVTALGARAVITKPVGAGELVETIAELVASTDGQEQSSIAGAARGV